MASRGTRPEGFTSGQIVSSTRKSITTRRQDFTYKRIEGKRLTGTDFKQSLFIGAILKDCIFSSVNFDRCDFSGTTVANCEFERCSFFPDEIRSCVITSCVFKRCDFRGVQWHGVVTEHSTFEDCDFREASIRESSFTVCRLITCRFKRSSTTMNRFIECSFSKVDLGDCTALFIFFDHCKFHNSRINAETIGFTYGLSEVDLATLNLIYLGRAQSKPSSDTLVDDLIENYLRRRWYVGACILQLNFRRAMPLLSLRALAASTDDTVEKAIPLDWDEVHFLVQVMERLHSEERLPFAGLWSISVSLRRGSIAFRGFAKITAAADLALRQIDQLTFRIIDQMASLQPHNAHPTQDALLMLRLSQQPERTLDELIPSTIVKLFDDGQITLIRSYAGSWNELWQLSFSALVAVQIWLIAVNGVVHQLVKLTDQAGQLAKKLGRKGQKRPRATLRTSASNLPTLSRHVTLARSPVPSLEMLARLDAVLNALGVMSDHDLEKLRSYAADRIEYATLSRISRRKRVRRIHQGSPPTG